MQLYQRIFFVGQLDIHHLLPSVALRLTTNQAREVMVGALRRVLVVLSLTRQLPWNQQAFWARAVRTGYLQQDADGLRITNFQALMEQE